MKAQIVSKFKFNWLDGHKKCFESHGWQVDIRENPVYDESVNIYILMWLDRENFDFVMKHDVTNIMHIRRYEFHTVLVDKLDWSRVNRAVVLNKYYADVLKCRTGKDAEIIYNGVIPEDWTFKKREHGKKIACIGIINYKKNFPLAFQVLAKLPQDYTLHIAGRINSSEFLVYLDHIVRAMNFKNRVFVDGVVEDIDGWLENKSYILSTSIAEGCPNNVIEAMAKGIKPVIHCWPGAPGMFGEYVFCTVDQAVEMVSPKSSYNSEEYRRLASDKFGPGCYEKLFHIAKGVVNNGQSNCVLG